MRGFEKNLTELYTEVLVQFTLTYNTTIDTSHIRLFYYNTYKVQTFTYTNLIHL